MKNRYIYWTISLLLILAGCTREPLHHPADFFKGDGRNVDVSLSVYANGMNVLANTKALDEQGERNVQDLYVAFFPVSGPPESPVIGDKVFGAYYGYEQINKSTAETGHSNAGSIAVHNIPTGTYYIVGVANVEYGAHAGFRAQLEAASSWSDFHDVAVTLRDDPAFPINVDRNTPALCMSGYYRDPNTPDNVADPTISNPYPVTVDGPGQLPGYIHLRRLDSHITFIVRNEIPDCKSFNMLTARMFNVPKSSRLLEDPEDSSIAYVDTEEKTNAWVFKPRTPGSMDEDKRYDSYVWSCYMMENRSDALTPGGYPAISNYKERELEYKNLDGSNSHDASGNRVYDYVYADPDAAFLEFTASMEQTMTDGLETFSRVASMKYVVHLGYCEGNTEAEKSRDFNNRRNTKYTYIIHVRGVNDIVVEAVSTELYDPSFSHGVEGSVIDLRAGQVQQLDTHYGVFNMSMTRSQISAMLMQIKSQAGEWSSVPAGGMISDAQMPAYISDPASFHPFPNYLSEDYQSIRIAPLPSGWDPEKKLVSYSQTYDFDWPAGQSSWTTPTTLLPMHGERKVKQDGSHIYPIFDLLSFKKAFSSPKTASNPWGYEVDGYGTPIDMDVPLHFTVFVNEYVFSYDGGMIPKTRALNAAGYPQDSAIHDPYMWHSIANTGHRFFRLISDGHDSKDTDSHYLTGSIHIEQRALQTYYSSAVNLAVAMEHTNEHHWKLVTNTQNQNSSGHGWLAAANVLTGNPANNWSTFADQTTVLGEGYPAFATKSYSSATGATSLYNYRSIGNNSDRTANDKWTGRHYFPTSGSDIDRNYYDVIHAALSRNRDLNRDGLITEDEIRWYLPFTNEYVNFAVGQGALETPLFSRKDYSADLVGNEQVYANRRFHYIGADRNYIWSEEGTSTGGGVYGWEIRCCRILGAPDDDYRSNHSLSLPYDYNSSTRVFNTEKFAENGIHRGYTKGALQPHDNLQLEANALPYYFKMAKVDAPLQEVIREADGMKRQQVLWNRMVTNEYCRNYTEDPLATFNDDGTLATANDKGAWHTPNQMELALMFYGAGLRPSGGQFVSSTYWWRNDGTTIPEGMVANASTDYRHYMGANGSNLRMLHTGQDLYSSKLIVRCVLDCDSDGRPIDTPEFGNPIDFHFDDSFISFAYDGDFADLSIGSSMSAGTVTSVTVNGVSASVVGGLSTVSTAHIPVNSSTALIVWTVSHAGKTLTYSHEYQLPARYWMISRYGVDRRYATVNEETRRTYISPAYYGDLDEAPAIDKWIITTSSVSPVNEQNLSTGVTYYFMNAGTRDFISGPTSGNQSSMTTGGVPVPIQLQTRGGYDGYYVIRINNSTNANSNGGVGNFGTWTGVDDGSTYKLTPVVMRGEMPLQFTFDENIIINPDSYSVHVTTQADAVPTSVTIDGQPAAVTGSAGNYTATVAASAVSRAEIVTSWVMSYQGNNITKTRTYVLPARYWVIESARDNNHMVASAQNGATRLSADGSGDIEDLSANYKWIISSSPTSIVNVSEPVAGEFYYLFNIGADNFVNEMTNWGANSSTMPVGSGTPMKIQFLDCGLGGCFSMKAYNGDTFRGWINRIDNGFGYWNTTQDKRTESGNRWRLRPVVKETPVLGFSFNGEIAIEGANYVSTATFSESASASVTIGGVPATVNRSGNVYRATVPVSAVSKAVFKAVWGISIGGRSYERSQSYGTYWAFRDRDNLSKAVTVSAGQTILRAESLDDKALPEDCMWLLLLPGDASMTNQTPTLPTNGSYMAQKYILYNVGTGLYLGTSTNGTNNANNFTMVSDPAQALQLDLGGNVNGALWRVNINGTGYFDRRTDWTMGVNSGLRHAWYFKLID